MVLKHAVAGNIAPMRHLPACIVMLLLVQPGVKSCFGQLRLESRLGHGELPDRRDHTCWVERGRDRDGESAGPALEPKQTDHRPLHQTPALSSGALLRVVRGRWLAADVGWRLGVPYFERSTNLTEWATLAVLTNSLGTTAFFDETTTNAPAYFYRARQVP